MDNTGLKQEWRLQIYSLVAHPSYQIIIFYSLIVWCLLLEHIIIFSYIIYYHIFYDVQLIFFHDSFFGSPTYTYTKFYFLSPQGYLFYILGDIFVNESCQQIGNSYPYSYSNLKGTHASLETGGSHQIETKNPW